VLAINIIAVINSVRSIRVLDILSIIKFFDMSVMVGVMLVMSMNMIKIRRVELSVDHQVVGLTIKNKRGIINFSICLWL
jgi:hypothetical protein